VRNENSNWLCYVRGPEGIVVELAEKIGDSPDRRDLRLERRRGVGVRSGIAARYATRM